MSVRNIYVGSDRIMCLTDTMVYAGKKPVALCRSKAITLSGGKAALCFRGSVRSKAIFEKLFEHFGCPESLDGFAACLDDYLSLIRGANQDQSEHPLEVSAVGWSERAGALIGVRYLIESDWTGYEATQIRRGYSISPGVNKELELPPANEKLMVNLALAQHKTSINFGFKMCIGGLMHLTTVTATSAEQRIVGAYPDYQKYARAFQCPNAEEYRKFVVSTKQMRAA